MSSLDRPPESRCQSISVVPSKEPGRAAVDELIQIGRVSADHERGHPQVRAALSEHFEDPVADRIQVCVIVSCYSPKF